MANMYIDIFCRIKNESNFCIGGSIWNLSKIGPEDPEELFEILNIFPIQMHKEAKLSLTSLLN